MSEHDTRDAGDPRPARDPAVPNTIQIMAWRGLLDAFGQLSAAWEAAGQAQRAADPGAGPGSMQMPDQLVSSFALVCRDTADVLTTIAEVLSHQRAEPEAFAEVVASQRAAREAWDRAKQALKEQESS